MDVRSYTGEELTSPLQEVPLLPLIPSSPKVFSPPVYVSKFFDELKVLSRNLAFEPSLPRFARFVNIYSCSARE